MIENAIEDKTIVSCYTIKLNCFMKGSSENGLK